MSNLRKKIAQLLCVGFQGCEFDKAHELQSWLAHEDGIGSLILFDYDINQKSYGKNFKSLEQLQQLNSDIKAFYQQQHRDSPPLWLAIDVEGGKVDRLASCPDYTKVPSAQDIAELPDKFRHQLWTQTAKVLNQLQIDINFAPVVDLNLSKDKGIFGPLKRCFSDDPEVVSQMAQEYLQVLNSHHILGCLKHFPGHGSAKDDSHFGFVDVTDSFVLEELIPYQQLCKQTSLAFAIMTAHVINRNLEDSDFPATFSKHILTHLLRDEFKFTGLIISDDLQMQAISSYYSRQQALLNTLNAGADMIIFGNQLGFDSPQDIIDDIQQLVEHGHLPIEVIDKAYERVLMVKRALS
jgi:beta-N-acetylhexosaminidase